MKDEVSGRGVRGTLKRLQMAEALLGFSWSFLDDLRFPGLRMLAAAPRNKLAFRFNAGRLSLNLVCTERYRPSKKIELLTEPSDVARWLFESKAVARPIEVNQTGLRDTKRLRMAIFEAASCLHAGKIPDRKSVAIINEFAAKPVAKVQLDRNAWKQEFVADDPLSAGLSVVARDAIDLLTGPQGRLIRVCDEPGCRMLFVDTSPGARRRWCSMTRCGSKSKGKAFRKRWEMRND